MADPEFTDTARSALLWVLWHHQGGSSPTGQAVRFALGMGQFDRMTADQVAQAKAWAPGIPGLAHTDPPGVTTAQAPSRYACPYCDQREGEPHGAFCRGAGTMVKRPAGGAMPWKPPPYPATPTEREAVAKRKDADLASRLATFRERHDISWSEEDSALVADLAAAAGVAPSEMGGA